MPVERGNRVIAAVTTAAVALASLGLRNHHRQQRQRRETDQDLFHKGLDNARVTDIHFYSRIRQIFFARSVAVSAFGGNSGDSMEPIRRFVLGETDKGGQTRHQDRFSVKSVCAFGPVFRLLKLGFKSV